MAKLDGKGLVILLVGMPLVMMAGKYLGRTAAEQENALEARTAAQPIATSAVPPDMKIMVSSQDAQGVSEADFDMQFLRNLEAWTLERTKANIRKNLAAQGLPDTLPKILAESLYVEAGAHKLAVVRLSGGMAFSEAMVTGVVGNEVKRVLCAQASSEKVPITFGPCADKIAEVFGVKLGSGGGGGNSGDGAPLSPISTPPASMATTPEIDTDPSVKVLAPTAGAPSTFQKVEYEGVRLEIPRNWKYENEAMRQQLNTATEATLRLGGVAAAQGDNDIVLAGSAPGRDGHNGATLRLSLRRAPAPSQVDMRRELSNVTSAEVGAIMAPAIAESQRVIRGMQGVTSSRSVAAAIHRNATLTCMYTEFEYAATIGLWHAMTWICPAGNRTVKLSASYRTTEAARMTPVIEHLWRTLTID